MILNYDQDPHLALKHLPLPFSPSGRDGREVPSEGKGVGVGEGRVRAVRALGTSG